MAIMDFLYCGEANVLQENLDAFLALAEELRLKGLTGGGAETEKQADKEVETLKKEISPKFTAPPANGSYDKTVSVTNEKINVELEELDEKIKSMITRSDLSAGPGKGKMASCNVCGKEGSYRNMPQHIEASHITGVSHACDICGKVSRSRNALRMHVSALHRH